MNILGGALSIAAAVAWTFMLIVFWLGEFHPTKYIIGLAMFLSIILFLTWATNSLKEAVEIK